MAVNNSIKVINTRLLVPRQQIHSLNSLKVHLDRDQRGQGTYFRDLKVMVRFQRALQSQGLNQTSLVCK